MSCPNISQRRLVHVECVCKWTSNLSKKCEDERVHQYLMGLNDDLYETLHSNIIAQDLLLSLNWVYVMVVQEERHKTMTKGHETRNGIVVFAIHGCSSNHSGSKGCLEKTTRPHYGWLGHEDTSCFKNIGYLEWWNNERGNGMSTRKGKGFIGARKGSLCVANGVQSTTPSFSA